MKFGIQLFGVLKDRRSDTMDALRSLAGLIPRPEGNEKLLQTQELFVCCHGWSGSFAAGSPYAFFGRADRPDDRFADDFRRQGADQVPVGAGNEYGHPHGSVISRLQARHCAILRTDEEKTIVLTSDAESVRRVR